MAKILIIDDEVNICKTLSEILTDENHECITAETGTKGLVLHAEALPDVVLLDVKLPDIDGIDLLGKIKSAANDSEVIMISGHATIDIAVKAVKNGAYHFIQKPLSLIEVKQAVKHAAESKKQRDTLKRLQDSEDEKFRMVGNSPVMGALMDKITRIAPTNARVIITGESGTGKELAAYAIHRNSRRFGFPYVKINCAAIPQNLIESELFGHEKGAFTGAVASRAGCFEHANCGTLFLDEIGDMDLSTQSRVLRVLQEGEFTRVGGNRTIKVDVRVISATHKNLEELIAEGKFREDLYYRLNVVTLKMPSLSERKEDIPFLADYFLKKFAVDNSCAKKELSQAAMNYIRQEPFRGNIRELKNRIEKAIILSPSNVIETQYLDGAESISNKVTSGESGLNRLFSASRPLSIAKDELEAEFVRTQLEINGWNIPKTAEILGIARTNLHRKIKQLGVEKK